MVFKLESRCFEARHEEHGLACAATAHNALGVVSLEPWDEFWVVPATGELPVPEVVNLRVDGESQSAYALDGAEVLLGVVGGDEVLAGVGLDGLGVPLGEELVLYALGHFAGDVA